MSIEKFISDDFVARLQRVIDEKCKGNLSLFSRITGIKQPTLYGYMQGRTPGANNLYLIAIKLNVDLTWLVAGKGHPYLDQAQPATEEQPVTQESLKALKEEIEELKRWREEHEKAEAPKKGRKAVNQ